MLRNQLRPAVVLTLLLCVLTGIIYPGVVTGLAQLLFPSQANGSRVTSGGRVVGSALIGQPFSRPEYFHPRPSAAGTGYDATASGGTNKGPTDRKLADTLIAGAVDKVVQEDGAVRGRIPADMVTASGSGLDPHVSPANAELQVARVDVQPCAMLQYDGLRREVDEGLQHQHDHDDVVEVADAGDLVRDQVER